MRSKIDHPGIYLSELMEEQGMSQRELASKIDVANSLLSNILNGNRNININLALSLEAANLKTADFWLEKQMRYSLYIAKKDQENLKKEIQIKTWNKIENLDLVPLKYLKKQEFLNVNSSDDIDLIYKTYKVEDLEQLKSKVHDFNLKYFRKSSKFAENRNNVIAWSVVAERKAQIIEVDDFNVNSSKKLVKELLQCFWVNKNTIEKTEEILASYGIKFFILNRPSKTPVDGKSFMSNGKPSIALTLKYKRLDNFAFTLFHELGHVFLHLTKPKYKDSDFFINNSNMEMEEFEANKFAKNNLIPLDSWNAFSLSNEEYTDSVIYNFAKEIRVHPAIIRGRVCFENPEYYRKRTAINAENVLM